MKNDKKPLLVIKGKQSWFGKTLREGDIYTKLSFVIMGISNIYRKQIIKGLSYLLFEIAFIVYLIHSGVAALSGLFSLGTKTQTMVLNETSGMFEMTKGDNSMLLLLSGVVTLFIIVFFIILWISSVKSALQVQQLKEQGKKIHGFKDDIKGLFDWNIHKLLLFIPITGLIMFTVLPLSYMILMAFTNYDVNHQPPGNLFNWVGLKNFQDLFLSSGAISKTFWPVLGWTMIWAVFATFSNYILGMLLAILINSKGIKFKKIWRTVFVLTIAIPSFVSLMIVRVMLNKNGVINIQLEQLGFITEALPFLTNATWARVTVIVTNMWIGIPFTMLITTGILMNIPADLYESAKIDGANPIQAFLKITMPYMLFVTTPYLISNFIANINNFNPIYFLTGGGPSSLEYFKGAGKTDLLVTWLFKMTSESKDYCYASAVGIIIFIISAVCSLVVYRSTRVNNKEEDFQ